MRGVIYKAAIAREISSSAQNACLAAGFRPDSLMELKRFSRLPKPQWCHGRDSIAVMRKISRIVM